MLFSKSFSKTKKEIGKEETSLNAQLLLRGGFASKLMAGVYHLLPLGWRVTRKLEQIIREEMDAIGGQEMFMPALQPEENWKKTGRRESIGDGLFLSQSQSGKGLVLGPTHEEVLAPLAVNIINSYKDLPFSVYQFQNKFRNEKRAKSGLLRGREFIMKDLYSFHADEKDLDAFYELAKAAYQRVFERCGIWDKTYLTYASGGTFAKYSHEFQTLTESGEDLIYICDNCRIAVNKEIIADQKNACPECGNKKLRKEKAVEVGNIFKLRTKFSEPFNLFYLNEKGEKCLVEMGCYGIGLQRLMGIISEISHDEKGIIWPQTVAPFKIHLVGLDLDNPEIAKQADDLYQSFQKARIEVLYDDRPDKQAGEKFADADLIGIPYRVVVSKRTMAKDGFELKKREEAGDKAQIQSKEQLLKILG
jgi:prolyl-tRNA synthetase